MLTKPLDPLKFSTVCYTLGLTPQSPPHIAMSATTPTNLLYDISDHDKDVALQTVFLQDAHEDADRLEALALE
jgi:hypothetical protein